MTSTKAINIELRSLISATINSLFTPVYLFYIYFICWHVVFIHCKSVELVIYLLEIVLG